MEFKIKISLVTEGYTENKDFSGDLKTVVSGIKEYVKERSSEQGVIAIESVETNVVPLTLLQSSGIADLIREALEDEDPDAVQDEDEDESDEDSEDESPEGERKLTIHDVLDDDSEDPEPTEEAEDEDESSVDPDMPDQDSEDEEKPEEGEKEPKEGEASEEKPAKEPLKTKAVFRIGFVDLAANKLLAWKSVPADYHDEFLSKLKRYMFIAKQNFHEVESISIVVLSSEFVDGDEFAQEQSLALSKYLQTMVPVEEVVAESKTPKVLQEEFEEDYSDISPFDNDMWALAITNGFEPVHSASANEYASLTKGRISLKLHYKTVFDITFDKFEANEGGKITMGSTYEELEKWLKERDSSDQLEVPDKAE